MLPTEPKSELIVSTSESPALPTKKALMKESMSQFTRKLGKLMIKNPFWALVIGSIGVHTAFVLLTPNPIKKTEASPPEVIVPTVKLPPKQIANIPKPNKSLFDDLFVKSSNKLDISKNPISSASDLSLFDRVENIPFADNNFPIEDFQDFNKATPFPNPVKTQDPKPKTQAAPPSRFTETGKIDNTTPNKPSKNVSTNIKPELQGNGLKNESNSNNGSKNSQNDKVTQNSQGLVPSKTSNDEKIIDFASFMLTDPDILKLRQQGLLKETQIASKDVLIPYPDERREKGVDWIPAKATNLSGKSGTVTYAWLVAPDGKVEKKFVEFKNTIDTELVNIVRETVKDYKFKPIDNPQSGKYRLVSAKYVF